MKNGERIKIDGTIGKKTRPPSRSRPILNKENREATPIAAVRTRPNLGALSKEIVPLGDTGSYFGFSATPSPKIDYDGSVEDQ